MTAPDLLLEQTLETILSTDLTRIGGLAGKGIQDALLALEAGNVIPANPARPAARRGLLARPGVGLQVIVGPGELLYNTSVSVGLDASAYQLGRLNSDHAVTISAPDPTLPRVDLIYGHVESEDVDVFVRNILQLPSRAVTPTSVPKTRRPLVTIDSVAGTPAANPQAPPVPAGRVALWHVYVPPATTFSGSFADAELADLRYRFHESATSRSHARDAGLYAGPAPNNQTDLVIGSGRAVIHGAVIAYLQDRTFSGVALTADGAIPLLPDTEYSVYGVGVGSGAPVGKTVADGMVPVLTTIPPGADGRPSAPITYRPLFGTGHDDYQATTRDALFLGTIHTEGGALFQIGGDGLPLNLDGTMASQMVFATEGSRGFPGNPPAWLRRPGLTWVDANNVTVGICAPIIGGVPGIYGGGGAAMPANLVFGEPELSNTFYYLYLRTRLTKSAVPRGATRSYVLRFSAVAPDAFGNFPSPEAGFASGDYLFVGSVFNDGAGNIRAFVRVGSSTRWPARASIFAGDIAQSPAFTIVQSRTPKSAFLAVVHGSFVATTAAPDTTALNVYPFSGSGLLYFSSDAIDVSIAAGGSYRAEEIQVPTSSLGVFRVNRPGLGVLTGFSLALYQNGYVEDLDAPRNANP